MARTLTWRDQIYSIRNSVQNSKIETWTRPDLERVFGLKRASMQTLMKAIGDVQSLGGKHVVSRASLLAYLDSLIDADDLGQEHRTRIEDAKPVPRPRTLQIAVPDDLRSIMVRDLPAEVTLEPGRLEIRGTDATAILENLAAVALAFQNDLDTAVGLLTPIPPRPAAIDDELQEMFVRLREQEAAYR